MASNPLCIDGSILEGGGQILRNAAALSCLLQTPITINNIRAGRSNPGLRPQHLSGLTLIKDICGGQLQGGQVGSTEVTFYPKNIQSGRYMADTKTAGSICLLIQASLPCMFYSNGPTELTLRGGTNADMAPQIDYLTWVFQPIIERFGVHFDCDIIRRGYFPKGGGEVHLKVWPLKHVNAIQMTERGDITHITGRAFVAGVLPPKIAHSMARTAQAVLTSKFPGVEVHIESVKESEQHAFGNGTGIIVMAETSTGCRLAGTALGKRGVPAEAVAQEATDMLIRNLQYGGCVDEYSQDQVIILMALAKGRSQVSCGPITVHTQTAIKVAEIIMQAKFEVKQISRDNYIIECEGNGIENRQI